jgi:hypothetical protein|tara:strand:+ start:1118 stop:1348 length:231 start_codon:yes stop_codon:yes gene_type:complete
MTTPNSQDFLAILNDLKYLHRLNRDEFWDLLFPKSLEYYVEPKWELFQNDKLSFLWSCSMDKIQILVDYINDCKRG